MHCTCKALLGNVLVAPSARYAALPPSFLLPSLAASQHAFISTSAARYARRDGNPARGISPLHRSGQNRKQKLSVKLENLPQPVLDPARRSKVVVDDNHGLWDFFNAARTALNTPLELAAHGRGWTVPELRAKDWDDLHRLWWTCLKERNRIATQLTEIDRIKSVYHTDLYGEHEARERMDETKNTLKSIRFVLSERWYAWENARQAAMEDPEVDLYARPENGEKAYLPQQDAGEPVSLGSEDDYRTGMKTAMPPSDPASRAGEART